MCQGVLMMVLPSGDVMLQMIYASICVQGYPEMGGGCGPKAEWV